MDRQTYLLAVPMTEEEALTLLRAAGAHGQDVGTFLSGIVSDIHKRTGDEGRIIADYLARSTPVGAAESYTAFCIRYGYDLDELRYHNENIEAHMNEEAAIRRDIEAGTFPEENGWAAGTTMEDAQKELAYHIAARKEAEEEKARLWSEYLEEADLWGNAMTEEEAMAEADAFQQDADALRWEQMTASAKAMLKKT